ncbi:MAG TPA: hypothetical protein PLS90_13625, partial [Candidatus Sumerlaeota bacterium]|nr:hypothetical protein [Candidatus Sumerlaeota bacterium]
MFEALVIDRLCAAAVSAVGRRLGLSWSVSTRSCSRRAAPGVGAGRE